MKTSFKISALVLALVAAGSASAALTINTTGWKADAIQTFSISGTGAAAAAGVTVSAAGTTKKLADAMPVDPETGEATPVPVFNFPVTKASVTVFTNSQLATPVSGDSTGAGLKFSRGANDLLKAGIGNFSIDYAKSIVYADVFTPTGTTVRAATFTYTDNKDTKSKLVGLSLTLTGTLKDLIFAPATATAIGSSLKLSAPLQAALTAENWGSIYVNVSSKSRTPKTNATPIKAAAFGL